MYDSIRPSSPGTKSEADRGVAYTGREGEDHCTDGVSEGWEVGVRIGLLLPSTHPFLFAYISLYLLIV